MTVVPLTADVYSVSQLTLALRNLLEAHFRSFWIEGEISNFRVPQSGHFYFTLKDEESQIRAVMFKSRNALLRFFPEDGMQVICRADLSVYPPRGEYQLVVDVMEPKGVGALQVAFEALKTRLGAEGLFDAARKKPLPFLPRVVGVITSPVGAAVRDIVTILWRRFPNIEIRICPVRVQGEGAAEEIAAALETFDTDGTADVIIVGRGGGSIEDLWAFNEEIVARAICACRIPVVSAVGHEIDFTIADFVADLRASTPSAAAELVVPEKSALCQLVERAAQRLVHGQNMIVQKRRERLRYASARIVSPYKRLEEFRIRLDDCAERMRTAVFRRIEEGRRRVSSGKEKMLWIGPSSKLHLLKLQRDSSAKALLRAVVFLLEERKKRFRGLASCLGTVSPLGVLARGYSITRVLPQRSVVRASNDVNLGQRVEVILYQGILECTVEASSEKRDPFK